MRKLTLLFPGQGSQRVGMASDLFCRWKSPVKNAFDEANEAIQFNLFNLVQNGPQEKLTQTKYAQPVILTQSIAILRILEREIGLNVDADTCDFLAGHSLGEYSALVAARMLSFADAVKLVHHRGLAMERAMNHRVGSMAALMPITGEKADEICKLASSKTGLVCSIANYNSSKQIVISGDKAAIEEAINIARTKKVRRAVHLDVSAPFHCDLMEPALEKFAETLEEVTFSFSSQVPIVWNVEGKASSKTQEELKSLMLEQIVKPVRWSQSLEYCVQNGAEKFLELGHGRVLTGLLKQQFPSSNVRNLGSADEIGSFLRDFS